MIIKGYDPGTEVRWNDEETGSFCTGIVRSRYYNPDSTEIDGETIEITVIGQSPTYKVEEKSNERMIIIDHTKVTLRHGNDHT